MRLRHLIAVTALSLAAAGSARADIIVNGARWLPICLDGSCLPDLVAEYEIEGMSQGFRVYNIGKAAAGPFHIAVMASADGKGIDVPGLAAGASEWFPVTTSYCNEPFTVVLNPFNALPESNYSNNALTFNGWCRID